MAWYCNVVQEDGKRWIEGEIEFACGRKEEKLKWYVNFRNQVPTTATDGEIDRAWAVLEELMSDPWFVEPGHNNDHGVNACIALHVLGCNDVEEWFEDMDTVVDLAPRDYYDMQPVFERVSPYLGTWGPDENRGLALNKMV